MAFNHMTFYGNPLHERHVGDYFPPEPVIDQPGVTGLDKIYRTEFKKRVPNLKKLDGKIYVEEEDDDD
ncbi:unnamed protein product [Didymodactylos carnosus]|uniref:Uncharacterized protein n=1 Tax=Didymodactylos carnosus TaxID=1234261 RepID=A0A815XXI5_9BILA|nr:unnamed protein product [Didymodactylos carnosus]CAF4424711.1 unnamed protein product [Didymodactylos carnosus]